MPTPQDSDTFQMYFKIPFTEITTKQRVPCNITTSDFKLYVNTYIRAILNINAQYYIEVVPIGKPEGELAPFMETRDFETLSQLYNSVNTLIGFYIRPVNPITREFIRFDNYN